MSNLVSKLIWEIHEWIAVSAWFLHLFGLTSSQVIVCIKSHDIFHAWLVHAS